MSILSATISLFLVFNVLGNIPFYIAILKKFTPRRQKYILIRELIIAALILLSFAFFGDAILHGIGISKGTLGIAGGVILFLISITMIFPKQTEEGSVDQEPCIVPIAIPAMAGPGSITAVMLYSSTFENPWSLVVIILGAVIPSLILLLIASNIKYLVGEKGLVVFERLGGLLICFVSIQMISSGAIRIVKENFPQPLQTEQVRSIDPLK